MTGYAPPKRVELWPTTLTLSDDHDGHRAAITYSDHWHWTHGRTFDTNEAALAMWNDKKPIVLFVHLPEVAP